MTDPLTDAYLDAIEQRAHAATEGPWEASAHDHAAGDVPILDRTGHYLVICPDCGVRGGYERADAEFIAHARSDVPALLAEVRRLRAAADARTSLPRALDALEAVLGMAARGAVGARARGDGDEERRWLDLTIVIESALRADS